MTAQHRTLSLRGAITSSRAYLKTVFEGRPVTKFIVVASGLVFAAGSLAEMYGRRKKRPKSVRIMPPALNHMSILRTDELARLDVNASSPVVLLSGPPLSGKTELSRQYAERFVQKHTNSYALKLLSLWKRERCHVICLQSNSLFSLLSSLRLAALQLGCGNDDLPKGCLNSQQIMSYCELIREKLSDTDSLLIFDNVSEPVLDDSLFQRCVTERQWGESRALLVVDSRDWKDQIVSEHISGIRVGKLSDEDAVELFATVSGRGITLDEHVCQIATNLAWNPGALACAAVGFKYSPNVVEYKNEFEFHVTKQMKCGYPIEKSPDHDKSLDWKMATAAIAMAVERLSQINYSMPRFASLLTCLHSSPVMLPSSAVLHYLGRPNPNSYSLRIPSLPQKPVQDVTEANDLPTNHSSYKENAKPVSFIESLKDFTASLKALVVAARARLGLGLPKGDDSIEVLVDQEEVLRMAMISQLQQLPCVRWIKHGMGQVETLVTNSLVQEAITRLVIDNIVTSRETAYVDEERKKHTNSWIASLLWSFDENKCLENFRQNLSAKVRDTSDVSCVKLFPYEAVHLRSLKANVLNCLVAVSSSANDVYCGGTTRGLLLEQIEFLTSLPHHAYNNELKLKSLVSMAAIYSDVLQDYGQSEMILQDALHLAKSEFSAFSLPVAKVFSDLGMIAYAIDDLQRCRQLLEQSRSTCESLTNTRDFLCLSQEKQVDITLTMSRVLSRLGLTYAALGSHQNSREHFEKAVMLMQSLPPDANGDFPYAADFSTAMIDLGHAYLCEGRLVYAKKVLELARNLNKNLRGEEHPEVVRSMEILSVALLLMGDKKESTKLMEETVKLRESFKLKLVASL
ncbi:uncharacterized protein LOC134194667 [Corticium candelabrum]|uniref:uncharacterized protein LOC134194667 n=1 Tax=Corticium candelabrum TaxID=121492 RepID=UPI002E25C94F|nr:uncharacterized protein LOC134194667 [Corticium candelabrum]